MKRQRWPTAAKHWRRRRRALRAAGEAMPTVVQVPPPWVVMRLAVRMRAASKGGRIPPHRWIGAGLDWLLSRPSTVLHRSATARVLVEALAVVAIIFTGVQLYLELENREEDRVNRAWSLIASAKQVQGNVGLIEALETLNARQIDMSRLELPSAYLNEVQLKGIRLLRANLSEANLSEADLSGAFLQGADLSGADLTFTNLSEAYLSEADLSGASLHWVSLAKADLFRADLSRTDLSGAGLFGALLREADLSAANLSLADLSSSNLHWANLSGADLSDADLSEADLSGANLSEAIHLTQKQLNGACGDEETKLPPGLTVPRCE